QVLRRADRARCRSCRRARRSPAHACRNSFEPQSLDRIAVAQMRFDDLVDVATVEEGVPDALGIDHGDRPEFATVEASRLVDAHLARAGESERLDALLRIALQRFAAMLRAAFPIRIVPTIDAEEDVAFVEGTHRTIIGVASS